MREREDLSRMIDSCLQALADGATVEQVLAMYPQQGAELRQALQIAEELRLAGQRIRVPAHAQAASKAQFLAHAENLNKPKGLAALWHWLTRPHPTLGSLVFGLSMLALILLAISSTQALPGDQLYPVKLAAEQASLSMLDDPAARLQGEENIDQKRAVEVQKMLGQNRENQVSFAGILKKDSSGDWLAAGIPLEINENLRQLAGSLTGIYIEIKGHTHNDGRVHVETLQPRLFQIDGVISEIKSNGWMVGKLFVQRTDETSISGELVVGSRVSVKIARIENRSDVLAFSMMVLDDPRAPITGTHTTTSTVTPRSDPIQGPAPSLTPDGNSDDEDPAMTETPAPDTTSTHDNHDDDKEEDDDDHDSGTQTPLPNRTATKKSDS